MNNIKFNWYNHFYQIHKIDFIFSIGVAIFITPYFYFFKEFMPLIENSPSP